MNRIVSVNLPGHKSGTPDQINIRTIEFSQPANRTNNSALSKTKENKTTKRKMMKVFHHLFNSLAMLKILQSRSQYMLWTSSFPLHRDTFSKDPQMT